MERLACQVPRTVRCCAGNTILFSRFTLVLLATIEYPLCAQDFTGFHGRVTDPSGAAAPAVIVKVTEETRGHRQSQRSWRLHATGDIARLLHDRSGDAAVQEVP